MSNSSINRLLSNNKAWAKERAASDPSYFANLAAEHKPKYLWIGCSDSRVPANMITGLAPGEMFVHRNVSNRVVQEDGNIQTVLQYAIESLKVEHIIVCGHYGCGGVKAGLEGNTQGHIRNWVEPIRRNVIDCDDCEQGIEAALIEGSLEDQALWDRACELNVVQQVKKLRENPFVQDAHKRGQTLQIHTWIYGLNNGLIKDLG